MRVLSSGMSVDYMSYVGWVRPSVARRVVEDPSGYEAAIEAHDGAVVFRPGIDRPFLPKGVARALGMEVPAPEDLRVSEAETNMLGIVDLERSGVSVMSSNFPLLPLVDRLIAIPHAVRFMEGFAYARLRPKRRSVLARQWPALMAHVGGAKRAARLLVPYIDRGSDAQEEAEAILAGISKGLIEAEAKDRDLLLLGVNLST